MYSKLVFSSVFYHSYNSAQNKNFTFFCRLILFFSQSYGNLQSNSSFNIQTHKTVLIHFISESTQIYTLMDLMVYSFMCVQAAGGAGWAVHDQSVDPRWTCKAHHWTVHGFVMWTSLVPLPLVVVVMMYCVVACWFVGCSRCSVWAWVVLWGAVCFVSSSLWPSEIT